MKPVWHDEDDAPIGSDGKAVIVGHLGSREQAERWQAKGYDIAKATDRYVALVAEFETAANRELADGIVDAFYKAERDQLRAAGVPEADPDFYRLHVAPKYFEFD